MTPVLELVSDRSAAAGTRAASRPRSEAGSPSLAFVAPERRAARGAHLLGPAARSLVRAARKRLARLVDRRGHHEEGAATAEYAVVILADVVH